MEADMLPRVRVLFENVSGACLTRKGRRPANELPLVPVVEA
jgi:hypothetical protein